jgi:hypothetical protein
VGKQEMTQENAHQRSVQPPQHIKGILVVCLKCCVSRHQHRRRLLVEAGDEVGGGGGGVRPAARGGGDAQPLLAAAVRVTRDVLQREDLPGGDLVRVLVHHLVVHCHRRVVVQADDDEPPP